MRGLTPSLGCTILALTLAGGCHRREPATRAVERYFAAVAAHDCKTLMAMTPPAPDATCETIIESFEHRSARLVAVRGSEPDGRERQVTMVRARVAFKDREADWLVRATPHDNGWMLRF
jgi:hypothetical protein